MIIKKTFRYRLEPTEAQAEMFSKFAGCARFLFNLGLADRKAEYEANGKSLSYYSQANNLLNLKKSEATSWLNEAHSQVLQQSLLDLDVAFKNFFRNVKTGSTPGFPKFKKRGRKDSFRYPQGVRLKESQVYLPKIGWVEFRNSRPIEGKILQTTVKREHKHWFLTIACEVEIVDPVPSSQLSSIGIDVGLKSFATLSDGTEIENPRLLDKALSKLKKEQKALSRKVKRSNNWKKQVDKVAKLHLKVKNSRKDFAHKVSTRIVKNHDIIAVETLDIKSMVKNKSLSRSISDVGWSMFLNMLAYKSEWAGKQFVKVPQFEPTSQKCSNCGTTKPMPLHLRTYKCEECGLALDRDLNASLNIRAAGHAVLNACGGVACPP